MKKGIIFIVLILIVAVSVITCPSKEMHKDAVQTTIKNVLSKNLNYSDSEIDNKDLVNGILSLFGSSFVGFTLDAYLTVDNYFVCSVGKLRMSEGKKSIVSIGVFNHIFTIPEEEIEKWMQE